MSLVCPTLRFASLCYRPQRFLWLQSLVTLDKVFQDSSFTTHCGKENEAAKTKARAANATSYADSLWTSKANRGGAKAARPMRICATVQWCHLHHSPLQQVPHLSGSQRDTTGIHSFQSIPCAFSLAISATPFLSQGPLG